jgi:hypothetical protein
MGDPYLQPYRTLKINAKPHRMLLSYKPWCMVCYAFIRGCVLYVINYYKSPSKPKK